MKRVFYSLVLVVGLVFSVTPLTQAADYADVLVVVDESGSMGGEHAWLSGMISDMETALVAAGVGDGTDASDFNRYGLVGFGSSVSSADARQINVGGGEFGNAAQFGTATSSLVTSGSTEDGWEGIDFALDYAIRAAAGLNVILVTDEDRDINNYTGSYNDILAVLIAEGAMLNSVVNATYRDGSTDALGVDSDGVAYFADGSGGYTTGTASFDSDSGSTQADYIDLAWATGGAFWDLTLLRVGGLTATSFTEAFIDIKVGEIQQQPTVPEPATMLLLGSGLLGLAALRRKFRKA